MCIRALALLALVPAFAACVHVDDDHGHHDPTIHEVEPNDFAWGAHFLGGIAPHERVFVRGHVTDTGSDRYDGFAFVTAQPMDVEFVLHHDDPHDDFDVELFDPYLQETVASWETGAHPEHGRFTIWDGDFEFHLVVSSFAGSGSYTLEVRGAHPTEQASASAQAQGASTRTERRVDWSGYAGRAAAEELGPKLTSVTREVDPATGATRTVLRREDELAAEDGSD